MSTRGQQPKSWQARWRKGTCPVHGLGLSAPGVPSAPPDEGRQVTCPHEECDFLAVEWPGPRDHHSYFGWVRGPDNVKASLLKDGEILAEGDRPGLQAHSVRTFWPELE